jgi:GNAT superfamily N-acetyltransferase
MAENKDIQPISIRPARREDAAALASLSGQLGYAASPQEIESRLARILSDRDHLVLIAESAGQPVGWIHGAIVEAMESGRSVEIMGLVVEEQRRGAGVGRALLAHVEAWAREKGETKVTLRSNVIRTRAHAFYQRLGYEITKTQHAFRKILK